MLTIRGETPEDFSAIHHINTAAFGRPNEADLVDALRQNNALTISLVAVQDGRLVGHVALSPVTITSSAATIEALGLAPMAVLPAYQREVLAPSSWKLGSMPVTKPPMVLSWCWDTRTIILDSGLPQPSPWALCGNMMPQKGHSWCRKSGKVCWHRHEGW
jgi:GNAT acetyltransferase-like protein